MVNNQPTNSSLCVFVYGSWKEHQKEGKEPDAMFTTPADIMRKMSNLYHFNLFNDRILYSMPRDVQRK